MRKVGLACTKLKVKAKIFLSGRKGDVKSTGYLQFPFIKGKYKSQNLILVT